MTFNLDDPNRRWRTPTSAVQKPLLKSVVCCVAMVCIGLGLTGCNQHRYQPAEWDSAPSMTTIPNAKSAASANVDLAGLTGITNWTSLPARGTTLPRNWTSLPNRGWTSLPRRDMTSLPNRGWSSLPNRSLETTMPDRYKPWSNDSTTMPNRGAEGSSNSDWRLRRNWNRFRDSTTLPSSKNPLRDR